MQQCINEQPRLFLRMDYCVISFEPRPGYHCPPYLGVLGNERSRKATRPHADLTELACRGNSNSRVQPACYKSLRLSPPSRGGRYYLSSLQTAAAAHRGYSFQNVVDAASVLVPQNCNKAAVPQPDRHRDAGASPKLSHA